MAARDPFSEREMLAIANSAAFGVGCRARNQALFFCQCAFGVRVSELLRLKRGDVLDDAGRLRERVTFAKTKNGRPITLDFVNVVGREYLTRWLETMDAHGIAMSGHWLFPGRSPGKPFGSWQYHAILRAAAKEIGFAGHCGTHSCRKTWAMQTYQYYLRQRRAGKDVDPLLQLRAAGGWETVEATSRYLASIIVDHRDSQRALYPGLAALVCGKATKEKYKTLDKAFFSPR